MRHRQLSQTQSEPLWYKDAIIYELHMRAFYDSNGDGILNDRPVINGAVISKSTFRGTPTSEVAAFVEGRIRTSETTSIVLRLEGFNLFNRFNEAGASSFFADVNAFQQRAGNGRYYSRPTVSFDPRQFQFGLKLNF